MEGIVTGSLLQGKNILVMGVRNKWSIAWGIARAAAGEGAGLIFACQGEREKEDTEKLASGLGDFPVLLCDIASDRDIDALFGNIKERCGVLHGIVHAIAHARPDDIRNDFIHISREGFAHALDISAYSLVAVCSRARQLMSGGGSVVTLTYVGSERVFSNYNVMGVAKAALEASARYLAANLGPSGIRVNAISAGPVKTISARGVKDFNKIFDIIAERSPLKRNVSLDDIGRSALYLLSDLSGGVTGEVLHVDCGFSIMGV